MEAPVLRVEDNPFLVNRYGKEKQYAEGRVSLEFAERVLGGKVPEGSEIVLALIEKGESPETGETYMARLKATKDPYPEDPEPDLKHPVLIDEIPDGMDYGTLYDFIVSYVGGDYMLFESQDDTEPIDHLVDLRDMQ